MDIFVIIGTTLTIVSICILVLYIGTNWGKLKKRYSHPFSFVECTNTDTYIYLYSTPYG